MLDLKRSDLDGQTREAAELFRLARRIGASSGLERSFKIAATGVDARRFLISLAPRPDFRAALQDGLLTLAFPGALRPALEDSLKTTRFLHLGYEQPQGEPVCKLYCESVPTEGERVRMHTGFKWRPCDPDDFACDEYWRLDGLDETRLRQNLVRTLEPNRDLVVVAARLLDRILTQIPVADLFYMEVTRGNVRRSCDLRLYDAGLTMNDVAGIARDAARLFGADGVEDVLAECGGDRLGHVSASPAFLTFYHGAGEL
jgi:hypothetical protein